MIKKIILCILVIITVIFVSGCIEDNSERILNDVAGIDNITLAGSTFSSYSAIEKGIDDYHNTNGDTVVYYKPSEEIIIFKNKTLPSRDLDKFLKNISENNSVQRQGVGDMRGYVYYSEDTGKHTYFFPIAKKIYFIEFDAGAFDGVRTLLSAWLSSSGFEQKWTYPKKDVTTVDKYVSPPKSTSTYDPYTDGAPSHYIPPRTTYNTGYDELDDDADMEFQDYDYY